MKKKLQSEGKGTRKPYRRENRAGCNGNGAIRKNGNSTKEERTAVKARDR